MENGNFLIDIKCHPITGTFVAQYANGQNILLGANTYQDAVLEADLIDPVEYV